MVGEDLEDEKRRKKFRVSRIRNDIRYATRRERDYDRRRTSPSRTTAADLPGRSATCVERPRSRCVATPPGGSRTLPHAGTLERRLFETDTATSALLASWVLRQNGRAIPLEPERLRRDVTAAGLAQIRKRHEGRRPRVAEEEPAEVDDTAAERAAGPVAPERFGVLQALLAHLLASCGDGRGLTLDAPGSAGRRFSIPFDQLDEHLSLLNLVNFGGCYLACTGAAGDRVHVDKELFGDVFRRPPRLTPLEARDPARPRFVGPMIAAGSRSTPSTTSAQARRDVRPVQRLIQTAEPQIEEHEEKLVRILSGRSRRIASSRSST